MAAVKATKFEYKLEHKVNKFPTVIKGKKTKWQVEDSLGKIFAQSTTHFLKASVNDSNAPESKGS
jgi:hypothetical protein